ncbi:MAG: hypothetical protein F2825_04990 [Actinobacteria bacterium]|uniref:Unannotated protein n=1 Tax=freshwater metagenome TaxID=449393 RepID=A0A6J7H7B8_9ZZZZ|nr:hypothetical protein [Actinomycetota bacterium]
MTYRPEYADVPSADGPEVDPHWLDLQRGSGLPASYLPPMVPGSARPWQRAFALVLITMLVLVTAAGICLTYGPHELFRLS